MKFKILLLAFVFIGQNLYPFEFLTPNKATKKQVMSMGRLMVELFPLSLQKMLIGPK